MDDLVPDVEFLHVTSNIEEITVNGITVYCFKQQKVASINYRDDLSLYTFHIPFKLDEAIEFAKTIK